MDENEHPGRFPFLAGAGVVLAWRAAALAIAYGRAEPGGSLLIETLLAALGVVFAVCGLVVVWRRPGTAGALFAGFCLAMGLHWGGPLDLAPGTLDTGLLLAYLLVSSILGQTLFLHLALIFPRRSRLADGRAFRRRLYAPFVLSAVVAVVRLLAPADGSLRAAAQGGFLLLHAVVSNLFAVLALARYIYLLARPGLSRRRKGYLALMVGGMLIAWLPYLAAAALGAATDPWNLTMAALPLAFTVAFFGLGEGREGDPAPQEPGMTMTSS